MATSLLDCSAPATDPASAAPAASAPAAQADAPLAPGAESPSISKRRNYARYVVSLLEQQDTARNTPLEFSVELANSCNLNCKFCMLHDKPDRVHGAAGLMPEGLVRRLQEQFDGAAFVCLHGHGEPLMNPLLVDAAAAARRQGAFVEFYTNGRMLTAERGRRLVDAQTTRVFVSLSTVNVKLYEHLYERGRFDILCRNLEALRAEKERRGSRWPELHFNAIAMKSTLPGFVDLVRFAGQQGASGLDLQPMVVYRHLGAIQHEAVAYDATEHEPILREAEACAAQFGMSLYLESFRHSCPRFADDEFEEQQAPVEQEGLLLEKPCPLVYRTLYVAANGNIKPCPYASKDPAHALGNLREQSLEEIWNGPAYRELRAAHREGRVPRVCRRCLRLNLAPPRDSAPDWLRHNGYEVVDYQRSVEGLRTVGAIVSRAENRLRALLLEPDPQSLAVTVLRHCQEVATAVERLGGVVAEAAALLPELGASHARIMTLGALAHELVGILGSCTEPPAVPDLLETLNDTLVPALQAWPSIAESYIDDFYAAHLRRAGYESLAC